MLAKQQHFSFSLTKPAVGLCEGKVTVCGSSHRLCHSGLTNTSFKAAVTSSKLTVS